MTEPEKNAKMITEAKKKYPEKPIICCFLGGKITKKGIDILEKNKIPNYSDLRRAVRVFKSLK
jgi:acyl-CoA synthetase (NDP forming)